MRKPDLPASSFAIIYPHRMALPSYHHRPYIERARDDGEGASELPSCQPKQETPDKGKGESSKAQATPPRHGHHLIWPPLAAVISSCSMSACVRISKTNVTKPNNQTPKG